MARKGLRDWAQRPVDQDVPTPVVTTVGGSSFVVATIGVGGQAASVAVVDADAAVTEEAKRYAILTSIQ